MQGEVRALVAKACAQRREEEGAGEAVWWGRRGPQHITRAHTLICLVYAWTGYCFTTNTVNEFTYLFINSNSVGAKHSKQVAAKDLLNATKRRTGGFSQAATN